MVQAVSLRAWRFRRLLSMLGLSVGAMWRTNWQWDKVIFRVLWFSAENIVP